MNGLIFEGRFLVNISGSIIRQDALRPMHGRLDWERMYRAADYNRIANLVYLGLMGNREKIPARWREHFFERYQEALRFGENCEASEKEILALLDMNKVSCIVLSSSNIRKLYQIPETAANSPLKLLLDSDNYYLVKGFLVDLGYESYARYPGFGELMMRGTSGVGVEIYQNLPFELPAYEKGVRKLMQRAVLASGYEYIHVLLVNDSFTFLMAQVVYHYVKDELLIRELLDLYLCYKTWQPGLNKRAVQNNLADLKIDGLAVKILHLAYMWFGKIDECEFGEMEEEKQTYDVLENRILSRGMISQETDLQAIELAKLIHAEEERERRRAKRAALRKKITNMTNDFLRKLRWAFPEYSYMCTLYPLLEKIPIFLPFFWIVRWLRFLITKRTR